MIIQTIVGTIVRSRLLRVILILALALGFAIKVEELRLKVARGRTIRLAMQLSNLVAERDSTRTVAVENRKVAALLGDSLRLVERKVLQIAQRADALDRAMNRERLARYTLDATIDSLRRSATARVVQGSDDGVRAATFDVRQPPYTVNAHVEIPHPPDSATMTLKVALDPVHVEARVTCSPPNAEGVRTAALVASTPPWVAVRFGRLEQSPEVCASPVLKAAAYKRRLVRFKPLVIGIGRVVTWGGRSSWWAVTLGSGFVIWS